MVFFLQRWLDPLKTIKKQCRGKKKKKEHFLQQFNCVRSEPWSKMAASKCIYTTHFMIFLHYFRSFEWGFFFLHICEFLCFRWGVEIIFFGFISLEMVHLLFLDGTCVFVILGSFLCRPSIWILFSCQVLRVWSQQACRGVHKVRLPFYQY